MAGMVRKYKIMFNTAEKWPEVVFTTPVYSPIDGDEDVTDLFYEGEWEMLSLLYPRYAAYLNNTALSLISEFKSKRSGDLNYMVHRSYSKGMGMVFADGDDYRIYTS